METHRRDADGRRRFSADFKQQQVGILARQEVTFAELSRELDISQSVLRRWKHLSDRGGETAVASNDHVVPATELKSAPLRIRELERALGRKTMEVAILQAARDEVKKKTELLRRLPCIAGRPARRVKVITGGRYKLAPICRVLGIGRSSAYRESAPSSERYALPEDRTVTAQIRSVIRTRASCGARRVTALANREFDVAYNTKRIRRVMDMNGWKLPHSTRRRTGRAHAGPIRRDGSNERWCNDGLEIACWNGEIVQIAFALDCHDREVLAHVAVPPDLRDSDIRELLRGAIAARFGAGARPDTPVQWLTRRSASGRLGSTELRSCSYVNSLNQGAPRIDAHSTARLCTDRRRMALDVASTRL